MNHKGNTFCAPCSISAVYVRVRWSEILLNTTLSKLSCQLLPSAKERESFVGLKAFAHADHIVDFESQALVEIDHLLIG